MSTVTLDPYADDLARVSALMAEAPRVAVILGSGLGEVAEGLDVAGELSYDKVVGMQAPTRVVGHAGRLLAGHCGQVPAVIFQGRLHTYQGVSAHAAAYPVLLAAALGARVCVVTNAAGGLAQRLQVGDLMLISDHINMLGDNPLRGWSGPEGGVPFVPMGEAYDSELAKLVRSRAEQLGISLHSGVYAAVPGPSYETPAEVEALRRAGADAVGMSTVPEVIAARALGMRVIGMSLITNVAGGANLSHEEVMSAGQRAEAALKTLLFDILRAPLL